MKSSVKCGIQPSKVEQGFFSKSEQVCFPSRWKGTAEVMGLLAFLAKLVIGFWVFLSSLPHFELFGLLLTKYMFVLHLLSTGVLVGF